VASATSLHVRRAMRHHPNSCGSPSILCPGPHPDCGPDRSSPSSAKTSRVADVVQRCAPFGSGWCGMAHQGAGGPQPRRRTRPAPPSVARPPRRRGRSSRPPPVAGAPHRPGPQPHPVSSTGHAASRVRGPPAEACSTSALALWLQRSLQRFDIHHLLLLPCSLSQPRCRHSFDVSQRPARVLVDQPHQNVDARGAVEPERVDDGSVFLLVPPGNTRHPWWPSRSGRRI
jgi:hypothetical protein